MKHDLPTDHGLPDFVMSDRRLMPRRKDGKVSITDVQHAGLEAGIARGANLLIVAPTSTGKTLLAAWAIAAGLKADKRAVYLVTHRALAKQKFDDLKSLLLAPALEGDAANIVLATGDDVVAADGSLPPAPLDASLVVATYEKYLGMLAASGIPSDLRHVVAICDEVQIVGDPTRGRNVEVLLTLLRQARCGQLIGLSATIAANDGEMVATWLEARLVRVANREKTLTYELRTPDAVYSASTAEPTVRETRRSATLDVVPIVRELVAKSARKPIIVFCMTKKELYDLARGYAGTAKQQYSLFGGEVESIVESDLAHMLKNRCAVHNADLTEEMRHLVEAKLVDGTIDVVFSTTTLAAGVNFPIATAIFASWARWDQGQRRRIPISRAEFHNMAGRAGRLGETDGEGRIVFVAQNQDIRVARRYLELDVIEPLQSRLDPIHFDAVALQLIAFDVCKTEDDAQRFIDATLSATREIEINRAGVEHWKNQMRRAIAELREQGFVEGP